MQGNGTSAANVNNFQAQAVFVDEIIPGTTAATTSIRQTIALPTIASGNQLACTLTASQVSFPWVVWLDGGCNVFCARHYADLCWFKLRVLAPCVFDVFLVLFSPALSVFHRSSLTKGGDP
jgi:hypothetical protein